MTLRIVRPEEFLAIPCEQEWDLSPWNALCSRLDAWAAQAHEHLEGSYACRQGCHHCCRRIASLLPVEWVALRMAEAVPMADGGLRSDLHPGEPLCGLLTANGTCRHYDVRPVICRTHGHALLLREDQDVSIDFCPKNFRDLEEIGEEDLLELDEIHRSLLRANATFLRASYPSRLEELWTWRIEWQADSLELG